MEVLSLSLYMYYGLSKELPVEELPRTTLHNPPRSKKQSGKQRKIEDHLFPNHCFLPLKLHGCSMIPGPPAPPPHIRNHANLYKVTKGNHRFTGGNHGFTKEHHWFTKGNHWFTQGNHGFTLGNHWFTNGNYWFTKEIIDFPKQSIDLP